MKPDRFKQFQARFLAGELTDQDFVGITPEDSVRARIEAAEVHRSATGLVVRADAKVKRRHRMVMSSEAPCGQFNDVVQAEAWDLTDYKKQGQVLLWAHDGSQPPLGRVDNPSKMKSSRTLEGMVQFMEEGISPFADMIATMVDRGIITNGSVGFHIKDGRPPTKEEAKKRGLSPHSMIITRALLKEFSIVPVGADPNAVKVRGDEVRAGIDGMVGRGEVEPSLAEMLKDSLNLWEPVANRSIVVPEMWRGSAEDLAPEIVEDDPESEPDEVDQNGERIRGLEENATEQERLIADQASTIEDLSLRLQEAEAAIERFEETQTRMESLAQRIAVAEAPFGIQPVEPVRSTEPIYAGLFTGELDPK